MREAAVPGPPSLAPPIVRAIKHTHADAREGNRKSNKGLKSAASGHIYSVPRGRGRGGNVAAPSSRQACPAPRLLSAAAAAVPGAATHPTLAQAGFWATAPGLPHPGYHI